MRRKRRKTILAVDDEECFLDLYREELEESGYRVLSACTGKAALEAIFREHPDLVILDIRMPDMDGIAILQSIREADKSLPVIMATSYPEYRQDFSVWSSDDFIVKTSSLDALKESIRRHIG